jgi:membrane protein YqaA with SNARE-associated domain
MKTNISMDSVVTMTSVVLCGFLNVIGYNLFRVAKATDISELPRLKASFLAMWRYCYGAIGLLLAWLPVFIPDALHNLLNINIRIRSEVFIFTSFISYAVLAIAYYLFVIKKRKIGK